MPSNILINPTLGLSEDDISDNEDGRIFSDGEQWLIEEDGQLSIDVFEKDDNIIVKSPIAGVRPSDLQISINNDMLTIRGRRMEEEKIPTENYYYRECHWGSFSRSIILPAEVHPDRITATLKNGILTISLPKIKKYSSLNIKIVDG